MPAAPFDYTYINATVAQQSPNTVHVKNTALARFFRRYLIQKLMAVYEWTVPESWDLDYFQYVLYCRGHIAIVRTDKFGVIPQQCGLSGYDVFYRPTEAIITNPCLRGVLRPRIGKQCTLIKMQPDYCGVGDLIGYYADMMALCSEAAGVNLFNSRVSYVFPAANQAQAESFKKMFDRLASGDPAAFVDKSLFNDEGQPVWTMLFQNVGQNYIVDRCLREMHTLEMQFDTAVGIPNANTDKRERLISDEVNANNVETFTKAQVWMEHFKMGCDAAEKMFPGLGLSVKWRFDPKLNGGAQNEQGETVNNRAV